MAENAHKIVAANRGTIRHSVAVDDIYGASSASAKIGGVDWEMEMDVNSDDEEMLEVTLYCVTAEKHADAEIRASYDVRLRGVEPIEKSFTHKFMAFKYDCDEVIAVWSEVVDPTRGFVVDGRITVEIDLTVDEVNGIMPKMDATGGRGVRIDDVEFADMRVKVKGEDWEGIRCHKAVMCRLSEAIKGAMTNASTSEAESGVFEIGDPIATKGGIEQFVRLNYKKYNKETMDNHVIELFVLGQVLLCHRVKVLATQAVKRLLSVDTFWPTLKAAVRIDDAYIIDQCVRFANATPSCLTTLINSEDGQAVVTNEDKEGVMALLVLMKAIGEKNKK